MQYGNQIWLNDKDSSDVVFKSYYVVWKRRDSRACKRFGKSLNRTMQYGNKSVDDSTQVGSEV